MLDTFFRKGSFATLVAVGVSFSGSPQALCHACDPAQGRVIGTTVKAPNAEAQDYDYDRTPQPPALWGGGWGSPTPETSPQMRLTVSSVSRFTTEAVQVTVGAQFNRMAHRRPFDARRPKAQEASMGTPAGKVAYNADETSVTACGIYYTAEELDSVVNGSVGASARDERGVAQITDLLAGVTDTDFKVDALQAVFDARPALEDWRVGEVIAEAYLSDHRRCFFPWPATRDLRDAKASLPGTDLVGFQHTDEAVNPHRFIFGEVKTSNDGAVPPNVMYGRHGLKQQLEDLRDSKETRHTLFLYLGWRAMDGVPWAEQYRHAAARYLADSTDVVIFGVLVRDVLPDAGDLRSRAKSLAQGCPPAMHVELLAIYLPANAINGLGARCTRFMEGRHANN